MRLLFVFSSIFFVFSEYIPSFDEWLVTYPKPSYQLDETEYLKRKSIYDANVVDIQRINSENLTWTAGVKEYFNIAPQDCSATAKSGRSLEPSTIPDAIDWS